jgi:quinol-cytochrome oxidoreductase complex cytochrome b subunit
LQRATTDEFTTTVDRVKPRLAWRVTGWLSLLVVMVIGFLGYTTPSMRLSWEAIAAMCGF